MKQYSPGGSQACTETTNAKSFDDRKQVVHWEMDKTFPLATRSIGTYS